MIYDRYAALARSSLRVIDIVLASATELDYEELTLL